MSAVATVSNTPRPPSSWGRLAVVALAAFVVGGSLYNLADYPTPWFDEGSHMHVPQTLVRYGEYAARSSDGFRYFGPTLGVGPTVMLPVAGAFALFGIGLLQARLVMVAFLLGAAWAFYQLARRLGGELMALISLALLVTSPALVFHLAGWGWRGYYSAPRPLPNTKTC
jgi:hypothetical protein